MCPPETYESYDFDGADVMVSDEVATDKGLAVYIDNEWCSVSWDSSENLKPLAVTRWWPIPENPAGVPKEVTELISGIRSINRSKHQRVMVDGDDEPCYWQRGEWVEWILQLADEAESSVAVDPAPAEPVSDFNRLLEFAAIQGIALRDGGDCVDECTEFWRALPDHLQERINNITEAKDSEGGAR